MFGLAVAGAALGSWRNSAAPEASSNLHSVFAAFGQTNIDKTGPPLAGRSVTVPIPALPGGAKKLELVWVPGSSDVKPFFMGRFEVTQAQYRALMLTNPSAFKLGHDYPVEQVSWNNAKEFCRKLAASLPGQLGSKVEFRLPTNAEWNVAVGLLTESGSASTAKDRKPESQFPWGSEWPPPKGAGNYADEAHKRAGFNGTIPGYDDGYGRTAPVGSFPANRLGLFDLGGNVWEWCEDAYPPGSESRTLRGASWNEDDLNDLLSAYRYNYAPRYRSSRIGFRLVLAVTAE